MTQPDSGSQHFAQRPEAVEAWFYLWRLTKDPIYRDWGWEFFTSFFMLIDSIHGDVFFNPCHSSAMENHTKRQYGYTGLRNPNKPKNGDDDVQQSYFLAETLKYLFLLFTPDDVIPLDEFVFNTEAHPLVHINEMYHAKLVGINA